MRAWKLEACKDGQWHPSLLGYAFAETEALDLAKVTSGLPFNRVHEKHPAML